MFDGKCDYICFIHLLYFKITLVFTVAKKYIVV